MGCPEVGWMVAFIPAFSIDCLSQSAARAVSALCSDRALTLGILRNSNSSSRIRESFCFRYLSRSDDPSDVMCVPLFRFDVRGTRDVTSRIAVLGVLCYSLMSTPDMTVTKMDVSRRYLAQN